MLCTLTTLKSVCTLRSVFLIGTMPITLPRREKAAPQVGQALDISPIDLGEHLKSQHGLSSLLLAAESWEHFCWKGNDLSAPLRALYVAEARGLLATRGDRANDVLIADIVADINSHLISLGKKPVTENSVLGNLKKAALYVSVAVGIAIVPDPKSMTVRKVDVYETNENIEKHYDAIIKKIEVLSKQVDHAISSGFEDKITRLNPTQMSAIKALAAAE
jgi:hypothetical protein